MRSLRTLIALVFLVVPTASLIHAQAPPPGDSSQIPTGTGMGATKEEVDELRSEVAAQKKTIEELKTLVQRLVDTSPQATNVSPVPGRQRPVQRDTSPGKRHLRGAGDLRGIVPGCNGKPDCDPEERNSVSGRLERRALLHPELRGQFQLLPYGYFQSDYRAYLTGDGAPPNYTQFATLSSLEQSPISRRERIRGDIPAVT